MNLATVRLPKNKIYEHRASVRVFEIANVSAKINYIFLKSALSDISFLTWLGEGVFWGGGGSGEGAVVLTLSASRLDS
jgi:hypothetical protein